MRISKSANTNKTAIPYRPIHGHRRRALVVFIAKALLDLNPIDLPYYCQFNEYEPEAESIVSRLPSARDTDDVLDIVIDTFCYFFEENAGDLAQYRKVAPVIWSIWKGLH